MSQTPPPSPMSRGAFGSEQLVAELYQDLRALSGAKLAKLPPGQTLQATALVHDAWLRLGGGSEQRWDSRGHFFASAAEAMRRILVEQARRKRAARHGADAPRVSLEDVEIQSPEPEQRVLEVNDALDALEAIEPLQARIVKLRYFAGLEHQQIADLLEVSEKTVRRHWTLAKVWLYERIGTDREKIK